MASSLTSRTLKVKFDGDTKGLARAAKDGEREVDRFSKSVNSKFKKSGDDSGKSFTQSLKKWLSPSSLGELGKSGGTVFGSGLLGAIKTPVLGPAILATLAAAVAIAAPAAGAIAASGLVAGFGAGLAGLGLVFAAKSQKVQDAWSKTLASMGADMTLLSKPFEATLISIAGFAQRTFNKFKPALDAAFKEMAPVVTKFADQVARGLEQLQPAVRPLADAFSAVLASLGPAIQGAMKNVSDGLIKLADSVKRNPDGLADLVDGLGAASEKALDLITTLNDLNGKFTDLTGGTSAVDLVFGKANGTIGKFIGFAKGAVDPLRGIKSGFDLITQSGDKATNTVADLGKAATLSGGSTADMGAKVAAFNATAKTAGSTTEALTATFNRQKAATDALIASMFRMQNLTLGLSGAQINYQAAVDDATASVKANGKTLDINTAKGRANKTALDQVASSANAQTQAMIESGKGTAAASKSATTARGNFSTLAQKMGLSKEEADALAASLIAIPPKKTSTVSVTGAGAAKAAADGVANSIRLIPGYKNIQIKYTTTGVPTNVIGSAGRKAAGGPVQPRRTYLVGERGPEYLTMGNQPGRVTSAEAGIAGSGDTTIIENHIEIGGEVVRVVRTEIKANDKNTKRRVTAGVR